MGAYNGRFHVDPNAPVPCAICDRCGFMYAHSELRKQPEWRGRGLIEKNILVCGRCYDKPNEQLRTIFIPPDPVPIRNPRPIPPYLNTDAYLTWADGTVITWGDGTVIESSSPQPVGEDITSGDGTVVTWGDETVVQSSGDE